MPAGSTIQAGTRQLAVITFIASPNAGGTNSPVTFGDIPIGREVVRADASNVPLTEIAFTSGTVSITASGSGSGTIASVAARVSGHRWPAVELTVNGSNFAPTSVVRVNGVDKATSFVTSNQLTATLLATDISQAGTRSITVFNPAPGGGLSNAVNLTVNNPAPTITSLSPDTAVAGGALFTMTVNGTNFVQGSVVRLNGTDLQTNFASNTRLTATVPAAAIASVMTLSVTVFNPTPGGGTSNTWSFAVINPTPSVTSLSPASAVAGTGALTLIVNGSNFVNASAVQWNGASLQTSFVGSGQLSASVPASHLINAGVASVRVVTPGPGGGTSSPQSFTITAQQSPAPAVTGLSPGSVVAGTGGFTLTVNGLNFVQGSVVRVNAANRATSFVSSTQLTAQVLASDIITPDRSA